MNQIPEAPGKDELCWLPLGGTGEIGMNLNLYGHAGQWLMIDLGITFPEDSSLPGIEVLMPDPTFIEERRDRLAGLVLTHGHEDHIGAVAYLWPRLGCPVYATPFTANLLRAKLQEAGLLRKVELLEVPLSGRFKVGPFDLELITLTHSIPEPNAVVIRTPLGTVLHTGDWKLDPDPVVGDDYDDQRLRALAGEGVMALIGDSTNAMVEGSSGSEAEVRRALTELIAGKKNRVIVTCFATNVARLAGIFHAAKAAGRRVCLVGRSMRRIFEAATETGYLKNLPPLVEEEDVGFLPRGEVLILATGSQGEARAAMMKLAGDLNKHIVLERGDTVIFSSRVIPGNERAIFRLQDALVKRGLDVITDANHFVHVSGHPAREELTQMYQWVRPQIAVPTHGTPRHIAAHAELARRCQVPQALETANGDWVQLTQKGAKVIRQVPTGRLALDGTRLVSVESTAVKARSKMGFAGSAVATVVINRKGHLAAAPQVSAQGLVEDPSDLELAVGEIEDALGKISGKDRHDDDKIRDALRIALRRAFFRLTGKKPVAEIHLIRL